MSRWILDNAQAALRDNLRTLIKESDYTQAGIAAAAGVKKNHLVGFLGVNNWLDRSAAEAFAELLDVSLDELVGGSIFKEQRDRWHEFDFTPPSVVAWREEQGREAAQRADELAQGRTRAICCTCGSLRTISTRGLYDWDEGNFDQDRPWGRMTRVMKCLGLCDENTRHAILRVDENRDSAEKYDRAPTKEQEAQAELRQIIARLAELNVVVEFRHFGKKARAKERVVMYEFDESKSHWLIEVSENLPTRMKVLQIEAVWARIADDDHGIEWDAREGVVWSAGSQAWEAVTDDLIADIQRHLGVERRRMVQQLNDDATSAQHSEQTAAER